MSRDVQIKVVVKQEVYDWLENCAREKALGSAADLAASLLSEIVLSIRSSRRGPSGFTPEEEDLIQARLRDLGYME